jgi:hypothetical protein
MVAKRSRRIGAGFSREWSNAGAFCHAQDFGAELRERAKELGADVVLVTSSFARNVSGVMPLLNYQPGQIAPTYSSGQVNANA